MNSRESGTLLIGFADDGTVHGLDFDYASRSRADQDPMEWFLQHLANITSTSMYDACGDHPAAGVTLAFPDVSTFRTLAERTAAPLEAARIAVCLIAQDGIVTTLSTSHG